MNADETGPAGAQPPQDIVAEESVLGSLMLSPMARLEILGGSLVAAEDFYRPQHETVFEAISALDAAGTPADATTVGSELARRGVLERLGGMAFLFRLVEAVPTSVNASFYAREVREKAVLRRLIVAGHRAVELANTTDGRDADELLAAAKAQFDLLEGVGHAAESETIAKVLADIASDLTDGPSKDTGPEWHWPYADMRDLVLPARPGQFAVIGARPSVGKSTLLMDMARYFALDQGLSVDFWSIEMPKREVLERCISAETRIPLQSIRKSQISESDQRKMWAAIARIEDSRLHILDEKPPSLADIVATARKNVADVILIDYIGLANVGPVRGPDDRRLRLGEFSRGLKRCAKSQRAFVAAASQLNRGPEQRADKRPTMSDLREFGDLEQDADLVILLHREDMNAKESERAGEADVIVAKQRNGPRGEFAVAAQLHVARFADMYGGHS